MTSFWQLPAPANFLRRVIEDLREGNNVVVAFPNHAPQGWFAALRAALAPHHATVPRLEEISVNGQLPLPALHSTLGLGKCSSFANVSDLCTNEGFHHRLIYLQDFTPTSWKHWSGFLLEYEDACRQFDLIKRTLFVATVQGDSAGQIPPPANLLRVHHWLEHVDSLNARLYAANLLNSVQLPNWHRQIAVALLSELALWDPEVIRAGISQPLANLVDPASWLTHLAQVRGWSSSDDVNSPRAQWRGLRQRFEGQLRTHSAWLAIASRHDALAQRVWNGQVTALFPLLERHRRELLNCHRGSLYVPWTTLYGRTIDDIEDLELSHIADQLRMNSGVRLRPVYEFVYWLRDIRNDLAHLNCVSSQHLLDPKFQSRMDQISTNEDA